MSNKNTSKNVWLHIMGVLILSELTATVLSLIIGAGGVMSEIIIVPMVFAILYGFWLYKKPHGNMLKYTMLLLALAQILQHARLLILGNTEGYVAIIGLLCAGVIIYVAGRLNRIEQNKYLLIAVAIITFVCTILDIVPDIGKYSPILLFSYLYEPIMVLALMIAYFTRYKEHKEAGLQDAPKAK